MKAVVFYHFLYPDDVVSSVHFAELCRGLVEHGWEVTGYCCTRGCRDPSLTFARTAIWNGVKIRRIWRPNFAQATTAGRLLNSMWMIAAWSVLAFNPLLHPTHIVIGTDPVMSVLVALPWRLARPRIKIAHWCFDVYPEAALADRLLPEKGLVTRVLSWLTTIAYRQCDLIADLGSCMKSTLAKYLGGSKSTTTIPVWAVVEPEAPCSVGEGERRKLFGDAKLALLYSGNFGKAHSYLEVLDIASRFTADQATFVFSVRGNRAGELAQAVKTGPPNVKMAEFAPLEMLESRLAAADIHIVTLNSDWTGTVVPSKFFGSLAAGRPVLFVGSACSGVAKWIEEFQVGWVIDPLDSTDAVRQGRVAEIIQEFVHLADNPAHLRKLFRHCHAVYQSNFSKRRIVDLWDRELKTLSSNEADDVL